MSLNLRNHSGVLFWGMIASLVFALLVFGCDEYNKTASILSPGKSITATQLQGETATEQATLLKQQTAIATSQKTLASSYQVEVAALQTKYQNEMQTDEDAATNLQTDAAAFNAKLTAAQTDLTNKAATVQQVVSVLGGVVSAAAQGTFNPLSLLTTIPTLAIGALGIGAMQDKNNLQVALTNSRTTTPAAVPIPLLPPAPVPVPLVVPIQTAPPVAVGSAGTVTAATPYIVASAA